MANHPIVHIDIPANDPKAASKFYEAAFDWKIQTDPTYDYHMFQAEGGPGGGFTKTGESMGPFRYNPGDVLIYLNTDDIDASLAKVTAHGGKTVLAKTEIPGVGWWAVFTDPTGNKLGLFTALPHQH